MTSPDAAAIADDEGSTSAPGRIEILPADSDDAREIDGAVDAVDSRQLIGRRVVALAHLIRVGARATIRHHTGLGATMWRILLSLQAHGPMRSRALIEELDVDKGQASRATRELLARKLAERGALRDPLTLTPRGRDCCATIEELRRVKYRQLVEGLRAPDLAAARAALTRVAAAAHRCLGTEPAAVPAPGTDRADRADANAAAIVDLLETIGRATRSILRDAYAAEKMASAVDGHALIWIAEIGPLSLPALSELLERDKAMMSRITRRLIQDGLITGQTVAGGRRLQVTPAGEQVRKRLVQHTHRLEEKLCADLEEPDRVALLRTLARILENARRMLANDRQREQAAPPREAPTAGRGDDPVLVDIASIADAGDGPDWIADGVRQMGNAALVAAGRRLRQRFAIAGCPSLSLADRAGPGEIVTATAEVIDRRLAAATVRVRLEAETPASGARRPCGEGTFLLRPLQPCARASAADRAPPCRPTAPARGRKL